MAYDFSCEFETHFLVFILNSSFKGASVVSSLNWRYFLALLKWKDFKLNYIRCWVSTADIIIIKTYCSASYFPICTQLCTERNRLATIVSNLTVSFYWLLGFQNWPDGNFRFQMGISNSLLVARLHYNFIAFSRPNHCYWIFDHISSFWKPDLWHFISLHPEPLFFPSPVYPCLQWHEYVPLKT